MVKKQYVHKVARLVQVDESGAGSFYDRIAKLYDFSFKFNGYSRSLEGYLRKHLPHLGPGARILDAGCGTGLMTLALVKTIQSQVKITAVDLSHSSLATARKAAGGKRCRDHHVSFTQANMLALPFADHSFDMIVTSGALEYVSLQDGLGEIARVIAPGGYLLHLPVRPSPASRVLEYLFQFKVHSPREVARQTNRFFHVVTYHKFPPLEPISWTKSAILSQKI
ncbi:MAG: class I SAM-dependent methyltransferase [Pyrinomonadaceae bacterium]